MSYQLMTNTLLRLFLAVLFAMLFLPVQHTVVVRADNDVTAPRVNSLSIKTPNTKPGELVKLDMQVVESESGIVDVDTQWAVIRGTSATFENVGRSFDEELYSGTISVNSSISTTAAGGKYVLMKVAITDAAGNKREYSVPDYPYAVLSDSNGKYLPDIHDPSIKCYISGNEYITVEGSSPSSGAISIASATLSKDTVRKGESFTVNIVLKKYVKLKSIRAGFFSGNRSFGSQDTDPSGSSFSQNGTSIALTVRTNSSTPSGQYCLDSIELYDTANNFTTYYNHYDSGDPDKIRLTDNYGENYFYPTNNGRLTILSDGDETPPRLNNITLQSADIKKPGVIKGTLHVTDNTGIKSVSIHVAHKSTLGQNGKFGYGFSKEYTDKVKDRTIPVRISLSTADPNGDYYFNTITLEDFSGNRIQYNGTFDDYNPDYYGDYENHETIYKDSNGCYLHSYEHDDKVYYAKKPIHLEDEFDVAFHYGLKNPNLLKDINAMKEGKACRIRVSMYDKAPKALFEAIKGKDKTLIFYYSNYQWIFNGKNITTPKDVRLPISFRRVKDEEFDSKKDMLLIDFEENGKLPGKATVRIKSDYTYQLYSLNNEIYIYYLNPGTNSLQLEKDSHAEMLDDTDRWLSFEITHNSDFYASGKKLTKLKSKAMKVGTRIKIKKFQCVFKVTKSKTLTCIKPIRKDIQKLWLGAWIKIDGITYQITSIAKGAFANCRKLTSVKLDGIREIGNKAFYRCTSLKDVNGDPDTRKIGDSAFEGCTKLTRIYINEEEMESIGNKAFYGCTRLKTSLSGCTNLTKIGTKAFGKCQSMTEIVLPSNLNSIGKQAFAGCQKLKKITVKTELLTAKNVGAKAFSGINKKAVFTVPSSRKKEYTSLFRKKGAPKSARIK